MPVSGVYQIHPPGPLHLFLHVDANGIAKCIVFFAWMRKYLLTVLRTIINNRLIATHRLKGCYIYTNMACSKGIHASLEPIKSLQSMAVNPNFCQSFLNLSAVIFCRCSKNSQLTVQGGLIITRKKCIPQKADTRMHLFNL